MEIIDRAKSASTKAIDKLIDKTVHGTYLITGQIYNLTQYLDLDPFNNLTHIQLKNKIGSLQTLDLRKIRSYELLNQRRRSIIFIVTSELNSKIYKSGL